jgi:hypothetical protein
VNPFTKEIYPIKDKALVITKPTINPIKPTRTAPLFDFAELKRLNNEKEAIQRSVREREKKKWRRRPLSEPMICRK